MAVIYSRDWNDGLTTNQTLFGTGGQAQAVVSSRLRLTSNASAVAVVRMDAAPSTTDFEATYTYMFNTSRYGGLTYRTTSWLNTDGTLAYLAQIQAGAIYLYRGTNSTGTTWTQIATYSFPYVAATDYSIKVRVVGSYHEVWVDGVLRISAYDATFPNTGLFGFRSSGTVTGYNEIDALIINDINPLTASNRDSIGLYPKKIFDTTTITIPVTLTSTSKTLNYNHSFFTPEAFNTKYGVIEIKQFTPVWNDYLINPIYTDATGYISGVVLLDGQPVINTTVRLFYNVNGKFISETKTNENGEFTFLNLEVGKPYYTVIAYNNGYNNLIKNAISPKKVVI